jgi:glutamine cyclotransferase
VIRVLDPETLAQTGQIDVTANGQPLQMINELEWVKGVIYANVWQTDRIARIDPATGHVTAWIDLAGLMGNARPNDPDAVLNGIAYDAAHDRLFVTGKRWPAVFEIRLKGR